MVTRWCHCRLRNIFHPKYSGKNGLVPFTRSFTAVKSGPESYEIDWLYISNDRVIISAVARNIYVGEYKENIDVLEEEKSDFVWKSTLSSILNAKITKSDLFGSKCYLIFTGIGEPFTGIYEYYVGFAFLDPNSNSGFTNFLLKVSDSNEYSSQKPLIALHPLSSKQSESKSHFKGVGLQSKN